MVYHTYTMRMRLDELRLLLSTEMLAEGGDVLSLAGRAAKNRAIIVCDAVGSSIGDSLNHAVIVTDLHCNPVAAASPGDDEVGTDGRNWTRLRELHGDSPFDTVLVLLAALVTWKRLVADRETSPAAQALIRRYWLANRGDPMRVYNDALPRELAGHVNLPMAYGEGYMRAGYLEPPDAPDISAAFKRGMQLVKHNPRQVQSDTLSAAKEGFIDAYSDIDRTQLHKAVVPVRPPDPDEKARDDLLNVSNGRRARTDPPDETLARLVRYIDSVPHEGVPGVEDWIEEMLPGWDRPDTFWNRANTASRDAFKACILRCCPVAAGKALLAFDDD